MSTGLYHVRHLLMLQTLSYAHRSTKPPYSQLRVCQESHVLDHQFDEQRGVIDERTDVCKTLTLQRNVSYEPSDTSST